MTQETNRAKTPSSLQDVKDRVGNIPLIRKSQFIWSYLAFLVFFDLALLPEKGTPGPLGLAMVLLFVVLLMVWAAIVFTDELKSDKLKTAIAFVVLFILGWLYYRYSTARWSEMTHLFFNVGVIQKAWPYLVKGFWTTILLAVSAAIFSTIIGLLLAVFRSFNNPVLNFFIILYIDVFRAIPIIVLMMVIYYAFPFMNMRFNAITAGIIALALNSSAYVAEIFRAGFLSIKKGQIEAAHALGLSPMQTMRLVVLPQAFQVVIPPLVGNYVASSKDTALASSISIIELLKAGVAQQSLLASPSPLIFVTVLYLVLFVPLTKFSGLLERKMQGTKRQINV